MLWRSMMRIYSKMKRLSKISSLALNHCLVIPFASNKCRQSSTSLDLRKSMSISYAKPARSNAKANLFKVNGITCRSPIRHRHHSLHLELVNSGNGITSTTPKLLAVTFIVIMCFIHAQAFASIKQPLPRWAATKSNEVNARSGPGVRYPTEWVFIKKGEPLEITAEFEQWRYVTDIKGEGGWIHSSVLSGKRSVVIKGPETRELSKSADSKARVVAKLSPEMRCAFKACKKDWCKIQCQSYSGWIQKKYLWGVYPGE
jgi:SH3-like domain-containing protein